MLDTRAPLPTAESACEPAPRPDGPAIDRSPLPFGAIAGAALLAGCGSDGADTAPEALSQVDPDLAAADDDPAMRSPRATKGAGEPSADADAEGVENASPVLLTPQDAARFLGQATPGVRWGHIVMLQRIGYHEWLRRQFRIPRGERLWDWMVARGYDAPEHRFTQHGLDRALWCQLIGSRDLLRQRVALALSEILVVNAQGMAGLPWKSLAGAAYYDLLLDHAFGNFRDLLGAVSTSVGMGAYLTFLGSRKENPRTGAMPDENYAREVMQLFTIGLYELTPGGRVRHARGEPIETYTQDDIAGLARVFTGWMADSRDQDSPHWLRLPMVNAADRHESGEKRFLGLAIPANTDGPTSLKLALDHLFEHRNVGPFICRQLIQRLVTSNPGAAYVRRVAQVFDDDGRGVRGDMKAVVAAILMDPVARRIRQRHTRFGKLREPMLRVTAWARAFRASTVDDRWLTDMSAPDTEVGQSPLRAPSVFNFFRPGHAWDDGDEDTTGTVLPELELVHETSAVGWLNFAARMVQNRLRARTAHLVGDYAMLGALPDDATVLVERLDLVLAGGMLPHDVRTTIARAVSTLPSGDPESRQRRTMAALMLLMSAPQYIHQK